MDSLWDVLPLMYLVGYQALFYVNMPNQDPQIIYLYMPDSLTEMERSTVFSTMTYYTCDDNTND